MNGNVIIDLPPDQIEYVPLIDLSGKPEFLINQTATLQGRLIKYFIKYPTNIAGCIPIVGSITGLVRIIFSQIYFGLSMIKFVYNFYSYGFFQARKIFFEDKEFADQHFNRGVIELIPVYNTIYLIYYDFVLCKLSSQNYNFY